MTTPSEYSTKESVNVKLAGAETLKGLGKLVSGIVAATICVPKE